MKIAVCALWLGTGFVVPACGGNTSDQFAPGLDPLDAESRAAVPTLPDDRSISDAINLVSDSAGGVNRVHATALVRLPLSALWEAMREPEVCVDRRQVTRWTVERNVEPEYQHSHRIRNVVDSTITVEFDNTWRYGVVEGTKEDPLAVAGRYQKTWGTTFIDLLAGSVSVHKVDAETSRVVLMEHLKAFGQDARTAESTVRDFYASLLARARMQPLPTY